MSSKLWLRIQRCVSGAFFIYTLCIGMNSYRYDHSTNTFKQTRPMRFTALLANILTLLLLPRMVWYSWVQIKYVQNSVYNHPLLNFGNSAFIVMRSIAIFYTVLVRYSRDQATRAAVAELQELRSNFIKTVSYNAVIDCKLNRLLHIKYACFAVISVCEIFSQINMVYESTSYAHVHIVLTTNMAIMLFVTTLNYFRNMWYVCRSLYYINYHLRLQLQHLLSETAPSSWVWRSRNYQYDQLRRLMAANWQCASIGHRFNEMFRFQMLCLRLLCFGMNVYMGYWLCITAFSNLNSPLILLFGFCTYAVSTVDLYLIDLMCDKTICTYNETISILRECNASAKRCSGLEVLCETFALRLATFKLRLSQCGLFEVDKRLLLKMFAAVVSNTLVLVQYHIVINKQL